MRVNSGINVEDSNTDYFSYEKWNMRDLSWGGIQDYSSIYVKPLYELAPLRSGSLVVARNMRPNRMDQRLRTTFGTDKFLQIKKQLDIKKQCCSTVNNIYYYTSGSVQNFGNNASEKQNHAVLNMKEMDCTSGWSNKHIKGKRASKPKDYLLLWSILDTFFLVEDKAIFNNLYSSAGYKWGRWGRNTTEKVSLNLFGDVWCLRKE